MKRDKVSFRWFPRNVGNKVETLVADPGSAFHVVTEMAQKPLTQVGQSAGGSHFLRPLQALREYAR